MSCGKGTVIIEMNAKKVKLFFAIIFAMALIGALSSCTSESGKRESKREYIPYDDAQTLLMARKLQKLGDTTRMFAPVMGTKSSPLYMGLVYKYEPAKRGYVRVRY